METHSTWSISLGRWGGLSVRIHSFLLLFAAFTLFLGWQASLHSETSDAMAIAVGSLGILLISVVLHELGHYLAAIQLGGDGREMVLGPLGGLSTMRPPPEPLRECWMHLSGPGVNLLVCLTTGLGLALVMHQPLWPMMHPLAPQSLIEGEHSVTLAIKLMFWINWVLFLINLLPAFPFDGGRALKAALAHYLPAAGSRQCVSIVATIAKVAAVAMLVAAIVLLIRGAEFSAAVPAWFALLLLAIFLYFSAKQEEERHEELVSEDGFFGYDFSQGYTSLEREPEGMSDTVGVVQRWLKQRRESKQQRLRDIEAEEEGRVDEILARLHAHGMNSLSAEDRSILNRVSERYRQSRD